MLKNRRFFRPSRRPGFGGGGGGGVGRLVALSIQHGKNPFLLTDFNRTSTGGLLPTKALVYPVAVHTMHMPLWVRNVLCFLAVICGARCCVN